jgi:hypothetical protein
LIGSIGEIPGEDQEKWLIALLAALHSIKRSLPAFKCLQRKVIATLQRAHAQVRRRERVMPAAKNSPHGRHH